MKEVKKKMVIYKIRVSLDRTSYTLTWGLYFYIYIYIDDFTFIHVFNYSSPLSYQVLNFNFKKRTQILISFIIQVLYFYLNQLCFYHKWIFYYFVTFVQLLPFE